MSVLPVIGNYYVRMPPFILFVFRVAAFPTWVATFIGFLFLVDDFELPIGNLLEIKSIHFIVGIAVLSFLYMGYGLWRDLKRNLPSRWNPWKKQALKNLAGTIEHQFEVADWLMGPSFSPVDAAEAVELSNFRAELRDLEIPFPDVRPGKFPCWFQWVEFLRKLRCLAARGDIEGARVVNESIRSEASTQNSERCSDQSCAQEHDDV